MNKTEFMEGIHILQNNYSKKFTTEQLKLFYENLKDMDKNKYIENIKQHIKNSQYMPNVAQIRQNNNSINANFENRDYAEFAFDSLYANKTN